MYTAPAKKRRILTIIISLVFFISIVAPYVLSATDTKGCKLKDGVFGRANEAERVKLKTYDEISSQAYDDDSKQQKNLRKDRSFPLIAVISGVLVFIILAVVILLWFLDVI